MPTGTVTYLDVDKGFGFLETGATKDNVYFQLSHVSGPEPTEGDTLVFDIEPPANAHTDDSPTATNIEYKSSN